MAYCSRLRMLSRIRGLGWVNVVYDSEGSDVARDVCAGWLVLDKML